MSSDLLPYNGLKRKTLAIFLNRGWLNVSAFAALVGFYPIRAAHTYLLRLHRFGLLDRGRDIRGLLRYRMSARGRRRLLWLEDRGRNHAR